jgi:hypothetical protein
MIFNREFVTDRIIKSLQVNEKIRKIERQFKQDTTTILKYENKR